MSEPWNPRRMWQFAALALLGSVLLAADGRRAPPRLALAAAASLLATVYILGCEPSTARLDASALAALQWCARVALAAAVLLASRNLIAVVAAAAAAYLLAGLSLVPELVVIGVCAPACVLMAVMAFTAKPPMGVPGIVGTVFILGSALERSVFGLRLAQAAFAS